MDADLPGERETLERFVDAQREELVRLLSEVDEDEARARLVPSLTTVLGLVKHATFVEKFWFLLHVAGVDREEAGVPRSNDETFTLLAEDTVDSVRGGFLAACAESRRIAAEHDLEEQFGKRRPVSLRWIYGHMIKELSRHLGHGDILVEQLRAARSAAD